MKHRTAVRAARAVPLPSLAVFLVVPLLLVLLFLVTGCGGRRATLPEVAPSDAPTTVADPNDPEAWLVAIPDPGLGDEFAVPVDDVVHEVTPALAAAVAAFGTDAELWQISAFIDVSFYVRENERGWRNYSYRDGAIAGPFGDTPSVSDGPWFRLGDLDHDHDVVEDIVGTVARERVGLRFVDADATVDTELGLVWAIRFSGPDGTYTVFTDPDGRVMRVES